MPGTYPPDVECCIEEPPGTDCLETVAHSIAVPIPELRSTRRYFFCPTHWPSARDAFLKAFGESDG